MDFGMRPYTNLTIAELQLKQTDNSAVLGKEKQSKQHLYIGLSKWGDPDWKEALNIAKAADKDMLGAYASNFNAVELNATHYKIYDETIIDKWLEKAGNNSFKFCPKMFNGITHRGALNNKQELLDSFVQSCYLFKEKLGVVFIQLSESFGYSRHQELLQFLQTLPTEIQFFVELRNNNWFPVESHPEFYNQLQALNIGLVITDTPGIRVTAHMHLTTPKVFVRFVCMGNEQLDYERIADWKNRLTEWYSQGLQEAYFFLHVHEEEKAIAFTKYVQQQFNEIVK